ncbi:MAG: hypothetical protein U0R52_01965 [Solirubrobacterales bacterium]
MRPRRAACACLCLLAAASPLAACGGSGSGDSTSAAVKNRPAPPAAEFPSAAGKTLGDVLNSTGGPSQLVVSPAQEVFYTGENRYSFGVFRRDGTPVPDAQVALYFAPVPGAQPTASNPQGGTPPAKAQATALGQKAKGPFPASIESLETEPAFRAATTANDPNAATVVYVTHVDFPREGEWRIAAAIKDGSGLRATLLPSAIVGRYRGIPRAGQRPPRIHTLTPGDVGGDLSKITTRVPPERMNQEDFYDALGRKPIVLLFATPQFCQSRVCGPVVDIAAQVQEQYGDKVDFIHQEIYKDNDPNKGVTEQVRAFRLPSEPWLFVIDRNGVVRTVIEGAFGLSELEKAVKGVVGS